jgi:hypothetical protein
MTTQLIILPNGRAKEINKMPYSDRSKMQGLKFLKELSKWNKKESSLKEYRITGVKKESGEFVPIEFIDGLKESVGSIAIFEINQEEGTCIIV